MADSTLGTPLGADLGAIELQLTDFWQAAARKEAKSTIGARCCNLVTITGDRGEAELLLPVLSEVAQWVPCRSLVAFPEHEGAGEDVPPLQGWISIQCAMPAGSGTEVCSEVITIGFKSTARTSLSDTLISLLVPDLPLYLYWRSPRAMGWSGVAALSRHANLLIVDSLQPPMDAQNRQELVQVLASRTGGIEIRDLSWSRLTGWRDLIAQFFDTPESQKLLRDLVEVEIRRIPSAADSFPGFALLLAGWLKSRLSWHLVGTEKEESNTWSARMKGAGGDVSVRVISEPAEPERTGIQRVTLKIRGERTFSVSRSPDQKCLTAAANSPGAVPIVHSVPFPSMHESDLLIRELSLPGEDVGFQATLAAALELERHFG